jgi:hypothetical protein
MNFNEWLDIGISNRWCGPDVCYTHDGLPASEAELDEMENTDICMHVIRLYNSTKHADQVESKHAPSLYRQSNRRAT